MLWNSELTNPVQSSRQWRNAIRFSTVMNGFGLRTISSRDHRYLQHIVATTNLGRRLYRDQRLLNVLLFPYVAQGQVACRMLPWF